MGTTATRRVNYALLGVLSAIMFFAGMVLTASTLFTPREIPPIFDSLGFPVEFFIFIGFVEGFCAILLWPRWTRLIGAGTILGIMIGALISTGRVGIFQFWPIDFSLAAMSLAILWLNRDLWPLNRILPPQFARKPATA